MPQPEVYPRFTTSIVEGLLAKPGPPVTGSLTLIVFKASRQAVMANIFTTLAAWLKMINSQRFVTNWRLAAKAAAIIPSLFNCFAPKTFCFAAGEAFHDCKVLMVRQDWPTLGFDRMVGHADGLSIAMRGLKSNLKRAARKPST